MSFIVRAFLAYWCAVFMACIINLRLGEPVNQFLPISAAPMAITAPTVILPVMAYLAEFRSFEYAENGNRNGGAEGCLWGIALGLAFYVPFFALKKKRKEGEGSGDGDGSGPPKLPVDA